VPRCQECSYEFETLGRAEIVREVLALADEHRLLLTFVPLRWLRAHHQPASWSMLEYACHLRDVLRFQRERVALALVQDTPRFVSMRRDERATEERYNEQDPAVVAAQITQAAQQFADALHALDDDGWLRTGIYPWPDPEVRTLEWVGRRTAHELAHHLFDERRLLNSAR
jgi:DinB superfamily